jgi:hypothetical protein
VIGCWSRLVALALGFNLIYKETLPLERLLRNRPRPVFGGFGEEYVYIHLLSFSPSTIVLTFHHHITSTSPTPTADPRPRGAGGPAHQHLPVRYIHTFQTYFIYILSTFKLVCSSKQCFDTSLYHTDDPSIKSVKKNSDEDLPLSG